MIVVSEMGEMWSPTVAPPSTAPIADNITGSIICPDVSNQETSLRRGHTDSVVAVAATLTPS